jgi:SulP family sulfate permease
MILLFILFLSPLIERIPLAALVGVMFVVAQQTFAWGSLRVLGKIPKNDAIVVIAVTVITVFTDLAIAVMCGIVIAALNFAWQHAREIRADIEDVDMAEGAEQALLRDNDIASARRRLPAQRTYHLHGSLFFASTTRFLALFQPQIDPTDVHVDCRHLHVVDHSAIAAIEALQERYQKAGKRLMFTHLSTRNLQLLERAGVDVAKGEQTQSAQA